MSIFTKSIRNQNKLETKQIRRKRKTNVSEEMDMHSANSPFMIRVSESEEEPGTSDLTSENVIIHVVSDLKFILCYDK